MHRRSARHWPRSRPARPRCSTSIAPAPTPATSTSSSIGGRRNDATYCVPDRRAAELCAAAPTANPMNDLLSGPPLTTRRRGTVLVVDDEEGVRASIRAILEETCEVLEAEHGAAALDILAHREVDLVMLDQRMPGESGVDVLPRVKALDPSVVVVIATAVRDVRTAVEALKRGAYDYLIKPFEVDDIIALADRVLEKRELEREVVSLRSALAHGGTVFLDEIGSLRIDLQSKLLRVLQEREIERVGGQRPVPVDVRVLAATNTNLRAAVRERTFRDDLFYRLNVVPLHIPPLRERREDIPHLVEHFVRKAARDCRRDVRGVSAGALEVLTRYDWPGNVRELENVIHRAVVLATGPVLHLQDVPLDVAIPETGARLTEDDGLPLREACDRFERQYVLRVLERVQWNVSRAARLLGVHRNTVLAKLSAWGVQRPGGADRSASL